MAKILADRDIRKLLGTVIRDADLKLVNPNGIELRLGGEILFHSTGEEKVLEPGTFLKVHPGESVIITSIETIDFTPGSVEPILPGKMLMGLITPTTTMMREGISQVATKIDAGFHGTLNWGLRNNSTKDLIIQYGEPLFKLTVLTLEADEAPEIPYGGRPDDHYQDADGVVRSKRRIPADIPAGRLIASSFDRLDPKKQLREAGYPFDHIGTELTNLHGKFELVSADVRLMKDEFESRISFLSTKIDGETRTLSDKVEQAKQHVLEKVEHLFDRKFVRIVGVIIAPLPIMYGGVSFLQGTDLARESIGFIAIVAGIAVLALTLVISNATGKGS
ncbi:MAG: dCTP deaminase domain-containing protein [Longimicrobiales bacterium]